MPACAQGKGARHAVAGTEGQANRRLLLGRGLRRDALGPSEEEIRDERVAGRGGKRF